MSTSHITTRQTKYCTAIESAINKMGHATNAELLHELQHQFPDVSATTIHRASNRLALRGVIALAPPAPGGSIRYDATTSSHDHFQCSNCGMLRDTDIKEKVLPILERAIDGCKISGRLTISGICKQCNKGEIK